MKNAKRSMVAAASGALWILVCGASAQDWPQWRGANRDAKAGDFKAPKSWPKELTKKWKTAVGDGVATPALVGNRLYVFSRQDGNEITRCLDAATGTEIWQEKYESLGASGPAASYSGPRSSPAVAGGKVVTSASTPRAASSPGARRPARQAVVVRAVPVVATGRRCPAPFSRRQILLRADPASPAGPQASAVLAVPVVRAAIVVRAAREAVAVAVDGAAVMDPSWMPDPSCWR